MPTTRWTVIACKRGTLPSVPLFCLLGLAGAWACQSTGLEAMPDADATDQDGDLAGTGGTLAPPVLPEGSGGIAGPLTYGGAGGRGGFGGSMGAGGATGTTTTRTTFPTCEKISTAVGVLNPCGHSFGLACSPDGRFLAAGFESGSPTVRLWRLGDGALLPDPQGQGERETTYSVAFSPDGKLLAAAGHRPSEEVGVTLSLLRLWEVEEGALVRSLEVATGWYADSVTFSHDGRLLAYGGYNGAAEIRRVSDGALVFGTPAGRGTAHNVHFSPDDSRLIVGTTDGRAAVWDVALGSVVLDKVTVASEMADADFSPDGKLIVSTGDGNVVRFWDATTAALLQTLEGHINYVSHVVWIDNDRVLSGDWLGKVILWARQPSGNFASARTLSTGGQVMQIGISSDRSTFVAGAGSQGFTFFSLD